MVIMITSGCEESMTAGSSSVSLVITERVAPEGTIGRLCGSSRRRALVRVTCRRYVSGSPMPRRKEASVNIKDRYCVHRQVVEGTTCQPTIAPEDEQLVWFTFQLRTRNPLPVPAPK